ncbi:MAG: PDZ domain-containing protein [Actinobacteria bacterium]|nr:PDZ domain-containing protein [Actinomycetota bacterium]
MFPFLLGVLIFLIGLSLSIGLHELGHLIPAKIFKVKVGKYMIGFGPTLFKRTWGETEYGLKALPLGGYISMAGMFPPGTKSRSSASRNFFGKMVQDARDASAETAENVDQSRLFYRLPVWKRIIIMFGGPFMNLVLAFVLFAIIVMTFGMPQSTTKLSAVAECTPANASCAVADSPGALAGLTVGDEVTAINGKVVTSWDDVSALIRPAAAQTLTFTVVRNGQIQDISVTPIEAERTVFDSSGQPVRDSTGQPLTEQVGYVGISPGTRLAPQPITAAFPLMGSTITGTANMIATLPQRLVEVGQAAFGDAPRQLDGPISVVGVGRVAGDIAESSQVTTDGKIASLLGILASLNIALFVFNMLPLLPLDGGHIAGALWELIRKGWSRLRNRPDPGPVDIARLMPVTFVVVVVMIAMSALLIYADIVKPVSIF